MKYKYNGQWNELNIKALDSMEIGTIVAFGGTTIPYGWLECNGASITQSAYPELYSLIGGTLPNFKGRVLVGQDTNDSDFNSMFETGGSKYLQEHTHSVNSRATTFSGTGSNSPSQTSGDRSWNNLGVGNVQGVQTGNSGNLQPYSVVKWIIKALNSTPTMASVVNASNNSTEDTYSCDYSNKHYGGVVLYENSTGTIGDITLSDSLDNYTSFELITTDNDDSSISFNSIKFDTSKTKYTLMGSSVTETSFNVFYKQYTKGINKLTASTGKLYIGSSGSVANYDVYKVYKVIGYK